jgi:hypothetical protein
VSDTTNQTEPSKTTVKLAAEPSGPKKSVGLPLAIVLVVVALVAGVLVGHFAIGSSFGTLSGKTTITESELDATVGAYTYNGATTQITAREAIEATSSLDAAKQDDDTYAMPSADAVLSFARNAILNKEVEDKGITVSDEDMSAYATDALGTDDYATIASQYGMTEDQVKTVVRESAGVKKLYDQIVTTTTGDAPTAPEAPADGEEDVATAAYGEYIVNLLGDNWDSSTNSWANTDNDYYDAMKDLSFSADSATYADAQTAYYVAYSLYSQTASAASTEWTNYVNGLLANASITIGELVS